MKNQGKESELTKIVLAVALAVFGVALAIVMLGTSFVLGWYGLRLSAIEKN